MPRLSYKVTKSRKGIGGRGKVKVVNCNPVSGRPSLVSLTTPSQPRPAVAKNAKVSSSKKKIDLSEYDYYISDPSYKNEIIDLSILSEQLLQNTLCKNCKQTGLRIHSANHVGLASKLVLSCSHCNIAVHFSNTKEITVPDVNKTFFLFKH